MNSFTFDVGSNITGIAYFFLILKYLLWPTIFLLLIVGAYLLYRHYTKPVSPFDPIGRRQLDGKYVVLFGAVILILVAISLAK